MPAPRHLYKNPFEHMLRSDTEIDNMTYKEYQA
ncbi:hypothetical protein C8N29_103266 [Agitococcus lubricus]|uniref:Uncharacterized protein n=1 Tax=Agitococcus lubricus TaxID=1077255 RepID=A0A2T5J250_9GAMM|nr:hypothetical protein C8N29_103266 [Agitococcus lubricus]